MAAPRQRQTKTYKVKAATVHKTAAVGALGVGGYIGGKKAVRRVKNARNAKTGVRSSEPTNMKPYGQAGGYYYQ